MIIPDEVVRVLYLGLWAAVNALCFVTAVWAFGALDMVREMRESIGIGMLAIGLASSMAWFWVVVDNYFP